jgi:hypothetical protein
LSDERHTLRESRRFQGKGPIVIQRQATPCRAAAKPELDNNVALQARVGIATGQVFAGGLVGATAYRRGDLIEKRRRMMADWGNFCESPVIGGKVILLAKARATG